MLQESNTKKVKQRAQKRRDDDMAKEVARARAQAEKCADRLSAAYKKTEMRGVAKLAQDAQLEVAQDAQPEIHDLGFGFKRRMFQLCRRT